MKELSLNILDIAKNSVKANASLINIDIAEHGRTLSLKITDDGCGMKEDMLKTVTDPFTTSRTTRKFGLGLPFLRLAAEQTGGYIDVQSRHESEYPESHGTEVFALFYKDHIDFEPLGDIVSTVAALIQGSPDIDFCFTHKIGDKEISLDTREIREVLGEDIPLSSTEVINWIADSLKEQYAEQ